MVPSLSISRTNGGYQVSITGTPADVYQLMASPNLIDWQTIATVTNVFGTVQVVDPISTNFSRRFYLEVMP